MADPDFGNNAGLRAVEPTSPTTQPNPNKLFHIIRKSLILAFVLLFISLFPSQAPNFVSQRLLTKFWELIHLLFVGIAVSYGLFGRAKGNGNGETHYSRSSSIDNSRTYLSGLVQLSSFFENGLENPCGSDEKRTIRAWNYQDLRSESAGLFGDGISMLEKGENLRSSLLKNGFRNSHVNSEKVMNQAWNYQYFQGEPAVAVANRSNCLDGWGTAENAVDFKPLGLPVRSLRSRKMMDTGSPESINRSASRSSSKGSSRSGDCSSLKGSPYDSDDDRSSFKGSFRSDDSSNLKSYSRNDDSSNLKSYSRNDAKSTNGINRDVDPTGFKEKCKESAGASPIPWRSTLVGRKRRKAATSAKPPSRSRPFTFGEFEFDDLKSSSGPLFSESSPVSSSPAKFPQLSSRSLKLPDTNVKNPDKFSAQALNSPSAKGETLHTASKMRGFSIGSANEINAPKSLKDNFKGESHRSDRENSLGRTDQGLDNLHLDVKPAKSLPRAKSVRTIRSSESFMGIRETKELRPNCVDGKVGTECKAEKTSNESMAKNARHKSPPQNTQKENHKDFGPATPVPDTAIFKNRNENKKEFGAQNVEDLKQGIETEFGDLQMGSDDDDFDFIDDAASITSEVDRKAAEFIAKFREQIRLQKTASLT